MFTLQELNFLTKEDTTNSNELITNVSIDGRKIKPSGLYIPIKGEKFDGHNFLNQAIENGAIATLWEVNTPLPEYSIPDYFKIITVDSCYESLHKLAVFYREKVNPKVIAITGSNGKTTTKDILHTLISPVLNTHKTEGNLNNHFGVPLTLLSMDTHTQVAIIEMGMSGLGEIEELSLLAKPDYAVITNIGESHLEQLKTRENIAKAKSEIVKGLISKKNLYFDGDEPLLDGLIGTPVSFNDPINRLEIVKQANDTLEFKFKNTQYVLPLIGRHHAKNSAYAISIASDLGISSETIKNNLLNLKVTDMRMQKITGKNDSTLFNDAYNASPVSMKGAINSICDLHGFNKKILILGDMLELGSHEQHLHESVINSMDNSITHVFLTGERMKWVYEKMKYRNDLFVFHSNSYNEISEKIEPLLDEFTVALFKASRGMKLDNIANYLKQD